MCANMIYLSKNWCRYHLWYLAGHESISGYLF